jgi:hypothetical protein
MVFENISRTEGRLRALWPCGATILQQVRNILDLHAAAVQAIAAIVTLFLTGLLAYVTWRYTRATDDSLALGRRQLELSREQFEKQWRPDVHLRAIIDGKDPALEVTNLGRMAIVITSLQLRFTDTSHGVLRKPFPRPFPLSAGNRDSLGRDLVNQALDAVGLSDLVGVTSIEMALTFTALGEYYETAWFRFIATVSRGDVRDLQSIPPPGQASKHQM